MRQIRAALAVSAAVTALSGLPVVSFSAAAATPVDPRVAHVPLVGVSRTAAAAPQPAQAAPLRTGQAAAAGGNHQALALSAPRLTDDFKMLGVTWRGSGAKADPEVWVRTRSDGVWSGWQRLRYDHEHAPDPGTAEAAGARDGTAPLWVGESDGVEVRVDTAGGAALDDLRADLVDPGTSPADAHPQSAAPAASAAAAASQPTIYTRKQWGADESLRGDFAGYGSTIRVGFVHHTVNANDYLQDDVPALIRGIYAYHVKSNGWSDIGYNFLVDRFGRLWEGRYGGVSRPVIGAHTASYNTDSFGVSAIGNFETTSAPSKMTTAISRLMAWKLGIYGRDPMGRTTLNAHSFQVISGHRDAKATACPGKNLYAALPSIRTQTKSLMGAAGSGNTTADSGRYDLAAVATGAGRGFVATKTAALTTVVRPWVATSGFGQPARLGGRTTYGPGIARTVYGRPQVFITGTDGRVYYKQRYRTGRWSAAWRSLGGRLTSRPAAASNGVRTHVFGRGADGSLKHAWWQRGRGWRWESLGGALKPGTGPGVTSPRRGALDVVVHSTNGQVYRKANRGYGWSGWARLGGDTVRSPATATTGIDRRTVVIRQGDGVRVRATVGSAVHGWRSLGGTIWGAPAALGAGGRLDVLAYGTDGRLHLRTRTPAGWTGWRRG